MQRSETMYEVLSKKPLFNTLLREIVKPPLLQPERTSLFSFNVSMNAHLKKMTIKDLEYMVIKVMIEFIIKKKAPYLGYYFEKDYAKTYVNPMSLNDFLDWLIQTVNDEVNMVNYDIDKVIGPDIATFNKLTGDRFFDEVAAFGTTSTFGTSPFHSSPFVSTAGVTVVVNAVNAVNAANRPMVKPFTFGTEDSVLTTSRNIQKDVERLISTASTTPEPTPHRSTTRISYADTEDAAAAAEAAERQAAAKEREEAAAAAEAAEKLAAAEAAEKLAAKEREEAAAKEREEAAAKEREAAAAAAAAAAAEAAERLAAAKEREEAAAAAAAAAAEAAEKQAAAKEREEAAAAAAAAADETLVERTSAIRTVARPAMESRSQPNTALSTLSSRTPVSAVSSALQGQDPLPQQQHYAQQQHQHPVLMQPPMMQPTTMHPTTMQHTTMQPPMMHPPMMQPTMMQSTTMMQHPFANHGAAMNAMAPAMTTADLMMFAERMMHSEREESRKRIAELERTLEMERRIHKESEHSLRSAYEELEATLTQEVQNKTVEELINAFTRGILHSLRLKEMEDTMMARTYLATVSATKNKDAGFVHGYISTVMPNLRQPSSDSNEDYMMQYWNGMSSGNDANWLESSKQMFQRLGRLYAISDGSRLEV